MQQASVDVNPSVATPETGRSRGVHIALLVFIFGAIWFAYFIQAAEGQGTGKGEKSIMRWLVGHWEAVSNYSHGPLIPLISAGLIFRKSRRFMRLWDHNQQFRGFCYGVCALIGYALAFQSLPKPVTQPVLPWLDRLGWERYDLQAYTLFIPLFASLAFYLSEQNAEPSNWGLAWTVVAVGLYWIAIKAMQQHLVVISFVILLYALPSYLWGRAACKWLVFPIAFLFLMVPLNFLDRITVPLANLATVVSAGICNLIGVEVISQGTMIRSAKGAFQFEIAEACSGIRSLVALGMVTAIYAYLTESKTWKRWAIFCASLPLAVLGNIARVTTIMLVAQAFGQELAGGLYHDYSSFIFFPVALLGMVVFAALLNLNYPDIWHRILTPVPAQPPHPEPAPQTRSESSQTSESPI